MSQGPNYCVRLSKLILQCEYEYILVRDVLYEWWYENYCTGCTIRVLVVNYCVSTC